MTAFQEMMAGLAIWILVLVDMLRRCGSGRLERVWFETPFDVILIWSSMALLGTLMLWLGAARWM